jgi:predicted DNA-binding transcriptional regulator AlpA
MKASRSQPKCQEEVIRQKSSSSPAGPETSPTELEELVRQAELLRILKVSRATVHRWVRSGHLCRPIRLSANVIAWRRSAVVEFVKSRENAKDG